MPKNIKNAYDMGMRTYSGAPGPDYFINRADYTIRASINPENRVLTGSETIVYYNRSPDTLKEIVIKLYQDLNKPGIARNFDLPPEALTEGVVISKFKMNGRDIDVSNSFNAQRFETNLEVMLDEPLYPSASVRLEIDWSFTIPQGSNVRMGTYDATSYYVAYWYPQVAVYDDIDGWDDIGYNGEQEMYNDFNNYDVRITMPEDFGVWATGMLQNPEAVLQSEQLSRYRAALTSDAKIKIVTPSDLESRDAYKNSVNTWHYKAENVPDFAFGVSDHYLWDASSVEIAPGRRVYTAAVYNASSSDFERWVIDDIKQTVKFLSDELPGVLFPYPAVTIYNGHGGMEFPMIINQDSYNTRAGSYNVTSHEVAHMYFPFYMGINEEKYAWMDEGITQMMPFELQLRAVENNDEVATAVWWMDTYGGWEREFPLMIPTHEMVDRTYDVAAYFRPAVAFHYLREGVGRERFDGALREFINRWHEKHPIPYDLFFTFNTYLNENLDWYWKAWFFDFGYADLGIQGVRTTQDKLFITIKNHGTIPVPIDLQISYTNGGTKKIYRDIMVWKSGANEVELEEAIDGDISLITLGSFHVYDINKANNEWER
jgi:hypothetical protein